MRIQVLANMYPIRKLPQGTLHHYDVDIERKDASEKLAASKMPPRLARKVFETFIEKKGPLAYDGRANAYGLLKIEDCVEIVSLMDQETAAPKVQIVALSTMNEVVQQALNTMMRAFQTPGYVTVGRNAFSSEKTQDIGGGLQVWSGLFYAVRMGRTLMLNADVAHSVFFTSGSLMELINSFFNTRNWPLENSVAAQRLSEFLSGLNVAIEYRKHGKTKYKVTGITDPANINTFEDKAGNKMTVEQYFRSQFNIPLKYPHLPCILSRKAAFPVELLFVESGQPFRRRMNEEQEAAMIRATQIKPHDRQRVIQQGMHSIFQRGMQEYGIEDRMPTYNAHILATPTVHYDVTLDNTDGVWNLRNVNQLSNPRVIDHWLVIPFSEGGSMGYRALDVKKTVEVLVSGMHKLGMKAARFPHIAQPLNQQTQIERNMGMIVQSYNGDIDMLVCLLPNKSRQLYREIKRVGETVLGILTQCLQWSEVRKGKDQYLANVVLKMNAKLGGVNQIIPLDPAIQQQPYMVLGIDVSHAINQASIAALVGSYTGECTKFCSAVRHQAARSEFVQDLEAMATEVVGRFCHIHNIAPAIIIVYRDGVSEGQMKGVLDFELVAIRNACNSLGFQPKITFIVVQKRHHIRIFAADRRDADRSGNCKPGTVVDTDIVTANTDFFLMSHSGILGTSRPAHYRMVWDDNGFSPDQIQAFTYRLCYGFARSTRAVGIPSAVYYAHLVAGRARCYGDAPVQERLRDRLYYL